jgi:hypothetical protein
MNPTLIESPQHRPRRAECGHETRDERGGRCLRCRTDPAVVAEAERFDAERYAYARGVFERWEARQAARGVTS